MLELVKKTERYVGKDNQIKEFDKYLVIIHGIECQLNPSDNTVRQLLSSADIKNITVESGAKK